MTPPAPTLQQLIDIVIADATDGPLERLAAAATTARDLESVGDALLGHFVDQCRRAGHSWTEISASLGVSKQAVHKRFAPPNYTFERFTDRAKGVLNEAKAAALAHGQDHIGTEHLLVGLFPASGLAAAILEEAGITEAKVKKRLTRGTSALTAEDPVPFDDDAKAVLEHTLREALGMGHNYIGTEHILLALTRVEDGAAAKLLKKLGLDADAVRKSVTEKLAAYLKKKTT